MCAQQPLPEGVILFAGVDALGSAVVRHMPLGCLLADDRGEPAGEPIDEAARGGRLRIGRLLLLLLLHRPDETLNDEAHVGVIGSRLKNCSAEGGEQRLQCRTLIRLCADEEGRDDPVRCLCEAGNCQGNRSERSVPRYAKTNDANGRGGRIKDHQAQEQARRGREEQRQRGTERGVQRRRDRGSGRGSVSGRGRGRGRARINQQGHITVMMNTCWT